MSQKGRNSEKLIKINESEKRRPGSPDSSSTGMISYGRTTGLGLESNPGTIYGTGVSNTEVSSYHQSCR